MDDNRISRLEGQVFELHGNQQAHDAEIATLRDAITGLSDNVATLTAALNRGQGALWGLGAAASILGGAAGIAAHKLFGG